MTNTAQKIISIARGEVGYHEGHSNGHWNNMEKYAPAVPGLEWAQGQAWCATFVSWVAMKAGAATLYPRTASCDVGAAWFKQRKQWSDYPAVGAQVFYGSPSDLNHTGIVVRFDATYIYTVEGNTNDNGSREGDGVYAKRRARRDANVVGYGYPAFPEGIVSADPAFKDESKPTPARPTKGIVRVNSMLDRVSKKLSQVASKDGAPKSVSKFQDRLKRIRTHLPKK